ncbi:MAG: prepilin-type N-terminal cleavage/methylation domain-containing protein [Desulfobacterales bacterium]
MTKDPSRGIESEMKKSIIQNTRKSDKAEQAMNQIIRCQKGFTLLEIMAAISIIAIVLVSVYKLHAQTIAMNQEVRFYATAPMLAQKKMAEIESKSRNDMSNDSGDFGDEFPNYHWNIIVDDVASKALGNEAEDLKRIDITVSFNNDEFTYALRTYKFLQD